MNPSVSQCVPVCPVECIVPNPDFRETPEQLLAKKERMHAEGTVQQAAGSGPFTPASGIAGPIPTLDFHLQHWLFSGSAILTEADSSDQEADGGPPSLFIRNLHPRGGLHDSTPAAW